MKLKAQHFWMKSASILLLCFIYYGIGYELERSQFWLLFSLYSSAFGLSVYLYKSGIRLRFLIGLSFLFKLIFLVSIPELSQDFYRFIWDGMLNSLGLNPYLHLPSEVVNSDPVNTESIAAVLYENMGSLSANNYSTYPPIAQLIYSLTYDLAGANLLLNLMYLRLFHLLAELGLVYFSLKILKEINIPQKQILFFIMNPLVILELSFSLHFEGIMLLFLGLSLYYLYTYRIYISALGFAAAVASKLLPLMFLPLLFPYLNKTLKFSNTPQILTYLKFTGALLLSLILAYSFYWDSEVLFKNSRTLALYFSSFEFNASFYYLLRWIGFQWSGYNRIGVFGKILPVITLMLILYLSLRHKKIDFKTLIHYMLFIATTYYLMSTTVHPWYITLPLFMSVFTYFKYMLLWSWLVFLSYSAYKIGGVEENHWLIGLQYVAVIAFILYEVLKNRSLFTRTGFLS